MSLYGLAKAGYPCFCYNVRKAYIGRLYMHKGKITEEYVTLYDSLSPAIFRHCFFRLSSRERALELTQESFMKAWEYFQRGDDIKNPSAFIYRIANNLIIDEYRKKKSVSLDELREGGFDVENHDEEAIVQNVEIDNVRIALLEVPNKYRQVLTLRFVDGLTPSEIGKIIGRTENAVSVQLNRAIKILQEILHL